MATTPDPSSLAASAWTVRILERCTACGSCLITCPTRALRPAPKKPLVIDSQCTSCGACIEVCPVDAIVEVPVG